MESQKLQDRRGFLAVTAAAAAAPFVLAGGAFRDEILAGAQVGANGTHRETESAPQSPSAEGVWYQTIMLANMAR